MVWGVVYWRGNCVQLFHRAKNGRCIGELPSYHAIQEFATQKPDYVLVERQTTNIAHGLGMPYLAHQQKRLNFKTLVYLVPQGTCGAWRDWFGRDHKEQALVSVVPDAGLYSEEATRLSRAYGFPFVDAGPIVDAWMAETPEAKFLPHILADWYHPNQYGAALIGQAVYEGIKEHWPELPVRPINMPPAPGAQ